MFVLSCVGAFWCHQMTPRGAHSAPDHYRRRAFSRAMGLDVSDHSKSLSIRNGSGMTGGWGLGQCPEFPGQPLCIEVTVFSFTFLDY